jgi:ankyrin repeat protein
MILSLFINKLASFLLLSNIEMTSNQTDNNYLKKSKHIETLFALIKYNTEEVFLEYLSALSIDDVDINTRDSNGDYLIYYAVIKNFRKSITEIAKFKCRYDILDTEGYTLVYYPIRHNNIDILNTILLADDFSIGFKIINLKDTRGNIPIHYAIKFSNHIAIQTLILNNGDPNIQNSMGLNGLHLAVIKKDAVMVKIIVKYIKNINARSKSGYTALHFAANYLLYDICEILLANGANPNIAEYEFEMYPIFFSAIYNDLNITKLLLTNGSNLNNQDYSGNTILHYAIANNNIPIVHYIIESRQIVKKTRLTFTENIVNSIYSADKIYPNIVNNNGSTYCHLMLENNLPEYTNLIKKILPYTNLNYQDNNGNTVLHMIALLNIWEEFNDILQYKKLGIYIKNNQGVTVIDLIPVSYREKFINSVSNSYLNILGNGQDKWIESWQNNCAKLLNTDNVGEKKNCINNIRNDITNKLISIPIKKDKLNITIDNDTLVHYSSFTGSSLDTIVGYKYITKKYNYVATVLHTNYNITKSLETYSQSVGLTFNPRQHPIQFEIFWIYQKIFFPPSFEAILKNIIKSKKYRFVIIPIGIILSVGTHSNSLIYDIEKFQLERFEPHGSSYPNEFNYNPELLDDIIKKKMIFIISTIYNKPTKITYYMPINYIPKIGFQTLDNNEISVNKNIGDPNGFCTAWTLWYIDYRVRYIDISPAKLINKLIREIKINNYSFRTIIRNYAKKITDLRDDYLTKLNYHVNDYQNNRISPELMKTLIVEILSDTKKIK